MPSPSKGVGRSLQYSVFTFLPLIFENIFELPVCDFHHPAPCIEVVRVSGFQFERHAITARLAASRKAIA